jgi:hypothetical protein
MHDLGLIDYWKNRSTKTFTRSCEPSNRKMSVSKQKKTPLSLTNLSGAFVVLGVGILASSLAFFVEILTAAIYRMKSRH